ncbi:hypothetical protein RV02_GL000302 [Enterococcus gilvus]|nr:hypothetical protein RV02_GL000302 [Enterococcus gilvus]
MNPLVKKGQPAIAFIKAVSPPARKVNQLSIRVKSMLY